MVNSLKVKINNEIDIEEVPWGEVEKYFKREFKST